MLNPKLIEQFFGAASIQRWNDYPRMVELVELDKQARESNGSTTTTKSGSSDRGYISLADCQNSEGKTKAQIEKLIGISLTIEKAATINSFSAVYNLAIKNMKNRYAPNTPAICSLSFEGNKPTSKVLVWSIIGN